MRSLPPHSLFSIEFLGVYCSLLPGGRERERADRSRREQERRSDRGRHELVLESVESAVLCRDAVKTHLDVLCVCVCVCVCVGGGGGGGGRGGELHDKLTSDIKYHVLWGTHTASWPSLVAWLQGPGC